MRFDIITIFPKIFDSYLNESMIKRARAKNLAGVRVYDLRKFSRGRHRKIDDRPYGGGPGMVVKIEPLVRALNSILKSKTGGKKAKVLIFSAAGKQFTRKDAADWAKKHHNIIMVCGHYEGIDERIFKIMRTAGHKPQAVSVGPYVLTGGELPAMIVIDAVLRHVPGFLGKRESLEEKRFGPGLPVYTRPEIFEFRGKKYGVPKVLLSGNHKLIANWRFKHIKRNKKTISLNFVSFPNKQ